MTKSSSRTTKQVQNESKAKAELKAAKAKVQEENESNLSIANNALIVSKLSQKHNIENRANLSSKDLKAIRSKNRRMLISLSNNNFTMQGDSKISNAKQFLSYVKNYYQFNSFTFSASELYSAKDVKTIADIQNLIDFCKQSNLEFKVYTDLNA